MEQDNLIKLLTIPVLERSKYVLVIGNSETSSVVLSRLTCLYRCPAYGFGRPTGRLHTLPNGLLLAIFNKVDRLQDAIHLCMSSNVLRLIGEERVCQLLFPQAAPWAGDRLINISDDNEKEDMPKGVVIERGLGLPSQAGANTGYHWREIDRVEDLDVDARGYFYDLVKSSYAGMVYRPPVQVYPDEPIGGNIEYRNPESYLLRWERSELRHLATPTYPNKKTCVLCNLTKWEYVEAAALDRANLMVWRNRRLADPPRTIGLGNVLALKTLWSPRDANKYHRGPWAGDRFVVMTTDRFNAQKDRQRWTDVGAETVKNFRDILDAQQKHIASDDALW